jgi:hypothetical protein
MCFADSFVCVRSAPHSFSSCTVLMKFSKLGLQAGQCTTGSGSGSSTSTRQFEQQFDAGKKTANARIEHQHVPPHNWQLMHAALPASVAG